MRTLCQIAHDIEQHWHSQYFGAKPYIQAMYSLNTINNTFWQDSSREIVLRFLCNAGAWHGPDARRIKTELKQMLKEQL